MGWERSNSSLSSTAAAAVKPPSTPPKLSYYTLSLRPDPPGMATPPINIPGSIPFLWEEAPGKPKRPSDHLHHPAGPHPPPRPATKPSAAKALDLPPRMLAEEMKTSAPSPTAVLDGPYPFAETGRSLSRKKAEKAAKSLKRATSKGRRSCELSSASPSSSSSSSSSRSSTTGSGHYSHISGCGFGFGVGGGGEREEEEEEEHGRTKVTISRISRSKSTSVLPSPSTAASHWLVNLYGNLRKVIQWRTNIKS